MERWNKVSQNDKSVFGKPDFVLRGSKIAIFCDGEFWHGRNWNIRKNDHKSNCKFWHSKIERNIERDKEVNEELRKQGWYLQPIITQYFIDNKSEIWLLFLIAHSKR